MMKTAILRVIQSIRKFFSELINQSCVWLILLAASATFSLSSCSSDKYADIKDWAERESVIIDLYRSGAYDHVNELLYRWLSEPQTMDCSLQMLQDSINLIRATSPDGKLDVFTWVGSLDGLVTDFNNVILYRDNGKVYSYDSCLWNRLQQPSETAELLMDEDLGTGCLTATIRQVADLNGRTVYLTENYMLDSTWAYGSMDAFFIADGEIHQQPDMFITPDNRSVGCLEYSYYMNAFYDKIESVLGSQSVFGYDNAKQELLMPVDTLGEGSDRYDNYRYNGSQFIFTGQVSGKYLHESLRDFEELVNLYWVEGYLIRIDRMPDQSVRYASWELHGACPDMKTMLDEPKLVLHSGKLVDDRWYEFTSGTYIYRLNAFPAAGHHLQVMKGDKVFLDRMRKF